MDKIQIKNLEVFAKHGVFPEENKLGQKFLVNAILYTNTRNAGLHDDLSYSIHYGDVCHHITEYMMNHTFKLIESAAENLAQELLLTTKHLHRIRLEILKPWAPIGLPLKSVSIEIERGWHTAYIAFGSNMGEKETYIKDGIEELKQRKGCKVEKVSSFFTTEPYGGVEQDTFVNGCLKLSTILPPMELLAVLNQIEKNAGRERVVRWGPRTLDLDIIFYDDMIYHEERLVIPHIDMHNRGFVLEPLNELNPNLFHPILKKTVAQLLQDIED